MHLDDTISHISSSDGERSNKSPRVAVAQIPPSNVQNDNSNGNCQTSGGSIFDMKKQGFNDSLSSKASKVIESTKSAHIACTTCRRRKLKCDGKLPACSVCVKLGVECYYESKRKRSGLKKGYVKELEEKLKQIEQGKVVRSIKEERPDMSDHSVRHIPIIEEESPLSESGPGESNNFEPSNKEVMYKGAAEPLPGKKIIDKLFAAYFNIFNYQTQLINEQKFRFLFTNRDLVSDNLRIPVYLVYSVMLIGMDYVPSCLHLESTFYDRARRYLEAAEMAAQGNSIMNIRFIQACCLLSHFEHKRAYFPRGWLTAGRACRAAVMIKLDALDSGKYETHTLGFDDLLEAMDLNKSYYGSHANNTPLYNSCDPTSFKNAQNNSGGLLNDFIDLDEKRHVLWNCFCTDTYSSVGTGWPMTFDESNIQTFLPISNSAILGKSAMKKRRHGNGQTEHSDDEDISNNFEKLKFISHHDIINPSGGTILELKDISRFSLYIIIAIMHAKVHKLSLTKIAFRDILSPSSSLWMKDFILIDEQLHKLLEQFPQPYTYRENNMARNIMTHIYLSFLDCLLNHHQMILAKTHELFKRLQQSTGLTKSQIDPKVLAEFNITFDNSMTRCYELVRFSTKLYRTMDSVRLNTSTVVMMSLFRLVKVQLSLLMYFSLPNNPVVTNYEIDLNKEKSQVVKSCLDFVITTLKLWSNKSLLAATYYKSALNIINQYNTESSINITGNIHPESPSSLGTSPEDIKDNSESGNIRMCSDNSGLPPVSQQKNDSVDYQNSASSPFSLFPESLVASTYAMDKGQPELELPRNSPAQKLDSCYENSIKIGNGSDLSLTNSQSHIPDESILVASVKEATPTQLHTASCFVENTVPNKLSSNFSGIPFGNTIEMAAVGIVHSDNSQFVSLLSPPLTAAHFDIELSAANPGIFSINNYAVYNGNSVAFGNQIGNNSVQMSSQIMHTQVPYPLYPQPEQFDSISNGQSSTAIPMVASATAAPMPNGITVTENPCNPPNINHQSPNPIMFQGPLNSVSQNNFSQLLNLNNPANPDNYVISNAAGLGPNPQYSNTNDFSWQEQLGWNSNLTIDALIGNPQGFNTQANGNSIMINPHTN
ncbi:hypothetical protein NADFUDRAFT_40803 [Nadsonia fulvescens var. elongata DSM 6958]|uniref:Zn(2)-C6 fungal-type domain-containing protein n=1 Tax=Nadsonia fulvescens var. elongata DSM 6958 TaxID=857566 RepID=A0A1E3PQX9_9ASCO|nr:hypothetical protein NADFUDRAFT_40803 [Nadsonia fulvescens var. elongata DSM 6958]